MRGHNEGSQCMFYLNKEKYLQINPVTLSYQYIVLTFQHIDVTVRQKSEKDIKAGMNSMI